MPLRRRRSEPDVWQFGQAPVILLLLLLLLLLLFFITPRGSKAVQTYTIKGIKCTNIQKSKVTKPYMKVLALKMAGGM